MTSTPQISIILPVFNASHFIRATLDSILNQTFQDFELIIINDGSNDDSVSIIESYNDNRIKLYHNSNNLGIVATLNKAIELCSAPLIARMDADDIMHPERLAKQFEKMCSDHGIAVLASHIQFINEDGDVTGQWNTDIATTTEKEIRAMMPRTNCIAHPSVMIRKEILQQYPYRTVQKNAEDWDLWLRILGDGHRIVKMDEILLSYRIHSSSIMAEQKKKEPLEVRLMRIRKNFILEQLRKFRVNGFLIPTLLAQFKNLFRHLLSNEFIPFLRATKRILTYPPGYTLAEQEKLKKKLGSWKGNKLFIFPYIHEGGAEQVHADILHALLDKEALVLIVGFSNNRSYLPRFEQYAQVLEIPNLANHPFTGKHCSKEIADCLNNKKDTIVFGSNTEFFFEVLPFLSEHVVKHYLIHAFKYQSSGNNLHKQWLGYTGLMTSYIFISHESQKEFEKLCFYNNIPNEIKNKFKFISNAVHTFHEPIDHETLRVLFVGRDSTEKRVDLFLKIAKQIAELEPEIEFSVVGTKAKKSSSNVTFFGSITDKETVNKLYREHDILLLTSEREGFPLVIMEAMAHGLAIGSTPVGDVPNRLDKRFSYITSSIEETAVVNELKDFILKLNSNPPLLKEMKRSAYNKAKTAFSWEEFKTDYHALFMR